MTDYDFGDIVLVPFPFTDQSTTKKRPAIVVSAEEYNRERPDIVLMAVTSQIRPTAVFGEVTVKLWQQAGLIKPSVVKPIFTTIEKGLVLRKLGSLQHDDRTALRNEVHSLLG